MYIFEIIESNKIVRKYKKEIKFFNDLQVQNQLPLKWHYNKLLKEGKIKVQKIKSKEEIKLAEEKQKKKDLIVKQKEVKQKEREFNIKTKKNNELRLFQELLNNYKVDFDKRRNSFELWRKNPKGFFNFITYFDNEEEKEELIKKDIQLCIEIKKKKLKKEDIDDNDI